MRIYVLAQARVQEYANIHGVDIIGDMPIYVGGQSADVWANRGLFELGPDGAPEQARSPHSLLMQLRRLLC
jgi:4-alpha-glucanotransferase